MPILLFFRIFALKKRKYMEVDLIIKLGESIKDPRRRPSRAKYSVSEILFMAFVSVLLGADDWYEMEEFSEAYVDYIRKFFPHIEETPSHDTFRRFFSLLKPKIFEKAFRNWVNEYFPRPNGVLAIDGKALCGAAKNDPKLKRSNDPAPLDIVTLWCREMGLSLGQIQVSEKSNEITAVPKLLKGMDLEGCIVTADAINCQEDIAKAILKTNADFLLACKGNQAYLSGTAKDIFEQREENLAANPNAKEWYHDYISETNGHGRIEKREVTSFGQPGGGDYFDHELDAPRPWKGIKSFVRVRSTRTVVDTGVTSTEDRFYLSSLEAGAVERIADCVRGHWSIENQLHWQLDVTFREDDSRRIKNAAVNISLINKIVLSVIKRYKQISKETKSMKILRKRASFNPDFMTTMMETAVWN